MFASSCPDGCKSQSWIRQKTGAQNSIQCPTWVTGGQVLEPSSASQGAWAGSQIGSRAAGIQISILHGIWDSGHPSVFKYLKCLRFLHDVWVFFWLCVFIIFVSYSIFELLCQILNLIKKFFSPFHCNIFIIEIKYNMQFLVCVNTYLFK